MIFFGRLLLILAAVFVISSCALVYAGEPFGGSLAEFVDESKKNPDQLYVALIKSSDDWNSLEETTRIRSADSKTDSALVRPQWLLIDKSEDEKVRELVRFSNKTIRGTLKLPVRLVIVAGQPVQSFFGPMDRDELNQIVAGIDPKNLQELLNETNKRREANGLKPLRLNPKLAKAASAQALDMVSRQYFAHESPDGQKVDLRVVAAGYERFEFVSENLAVGQKTAAETVEGWMKSPGHRKNLLDPDAEEVGFAVAAGVLPQLSTDTLVLFWVQVLGKPQKAVKN